MKKLTLQMLKEMKPDTIFASGITLILHPWFNNAKKISDGGSLEEDGKYTKVHWVAIRGGMWDWAIYHSLDANLEHADYLDGKAHLNYSDMFIADHGAKLHNIEKIKELIECDEEAIQMYRH